MMQPITPFEGAQCEYCGEELGDYDLVYECTDCGSIFCARCTQDDEATQGGFVLPVIPAIVAPVLETPMHQRNRQEASWN